jgi:hypothetical protein
MADQHDQPLMRMTIMHHHALPRRGRRRPAAGRPASTRLYIKSIMSGRRRQAIWAHTAHSNTMQCSGAPQARRALRSERPKSCHAMPLRCGFLSALLFGTQLAGWFGVSADLRVAQYRRSLSQSQINQYSTLVVEVEE